MPLESWEQVLQPEKLFRLAKHVWSMRFQRSPDFRESNQRRSFNPA
jgi:hypothetical protein